MISDYPSGLSLPNAISRYGFIRGHGRSCMNQEMWSRQIAIPGFGEEGQQKLKESRIAMLGLGGVGCPAALYLAVAGVGSLVLVDGDCVQISNLNRQILFDSSDLGRSKAHVAAKRLQHLNPDLNVEVIDKQIEEKDMEEILAGCQFVLDGFDRNADRLAVNRTCIRLGIPAANGFAQDFSGEAKNLSSHLPIKYHSINEKRWMNSWRELSLE